MMRGPFASSTNFSDGLGPEPFPFQEAASTLESEGKKKKSKPGKPNE